MDKPEVLFDESHCGQCACGEGLDFSFSFAFQPIVDAAQKSVYAYEALVRGTNGEGAMSVLSQVNERNRYSFDQICRVKAVKLASRLDMQPMLSINFMPNAVYRAEYCIRTTLAAAKTYNFDTSKIIFELTEGENLSSVEHLTSIIEAYQEMGFSTAIDDFGAGYSRFNIMMASPPDLLKLDMALVRNIHNEPNKQAVVAGIITMMRQLGGKIVAEGVETPEEYYWLRSQGITLFQGFLFAKPGFECLPEPVWPD
ncbi:EAL domain, c-di-GMP-specific phosphodiesterase class I (or its enzymatically inactive variant) [Marinobacter persicus]|uniref:EAL domain, c-di-GMP-specific phosphodiesterase class I (Or its enzymatically inactive variant) n=1 Tax=Marinobacter persicus TaxID=930118 RepID=A0A1I3UCB7_9GAMM|nr:EAL domain-containing protein [Marinobacter persicus]GHD54293.1 diguanylate phosphodiesterase [Marinobacter persicus]SFJ79516.1 EAL domain, c-di-GMP-specific phosphodiesterase class I (or its enzymatically inactive variant) [Marinobacter persicus]